MNVPCRTISKCRAAFLCVTCVPSTCQGLVSNLFERLKIEEFELVEGLLVRGMCVQYKCLACVSNTTLNPKPIA